ncbi:Tetratricopeptide repeat-containing protein [Frateuria terrea]|uniref:Tetratricopeptide repeat-containing protein n=1 Tax=Frateuria terrea TaxID=529704 RepID=A0A1H6X4H6_9GAMM|nr:sulfotransferase [Frateuria terrea]SEJ22414.1 Tetratricopeptide repeat-containing protein [Frateuria terrea]SFP58637.1 Tetratricopeptide repeat-containing protein [Frateuria terrea]
MTEQNPAIEAASAFNRRDWRLARKFALRALRAAPQAGMHYIAGVASVELQELGLAHAHLRQATSMAPDRADFAAQLAKVLSIARFGKEALEVAERAFALAPTDPTTLDTLGVVFTQANAYTRASEAFRLAAGRMPGNPHYRFNLATALIYAGCLQEAEQELEACLALQPSWWKAHLTLAQLRRQTPEQNHLERLTSLLPQAEQAQAGRIYVNLALAKEYEDVGDYRQAFEHLSRGKAAGGEGRGYSHRRDEELFEAIRRAFPAPSCPGGGHPTREPIFVIGMPRSGTTLVERILTAHPDVHSAGELQNFGVVLKRLSGSRTPLLLDPPTIERARQLDPMQLGEAYLASTRPATGTTARFVDKLPHNFLYAGFIAQALPDARIICLRREPLDTCLSNFRQLFALSSPYYDYSFDLMDTGRYYVLFEQLLAHWRRVMPGRILEVQYECLVDRQEEATRGLLEHCGLPWHGDCLRFERNQAPVATASAVQVREPMNRKSIQRWKKYQEQLRPLQTLLDAAGIALEREAPSDG